MEDEAINKLTKHFVDQGLLIEAGWQELTIDVCVAQCATNTN